MRERQRGEGKGGETEMMDVPRRMSADLRVCRARELKIDGRGGQVCVKCRRGEEGWCWKLDRSRVDLRACRGRKVMIMKMRQRGSGSRSDF